MFDHLFFTHLKHYLNPKHAANISPFNWYVIDAAEIEEMRKLV